MGAAAALERQPGTLGCVMTFSLHTLITTAAPFHHRTTRQRVVVVTEERQELRLERCSRPSRCPPSNQVPALHHTHCPLSRPAPSTAPRAAQALCAFAAHAALLLSVCLLATVLSSVHLPLRSFLAALLAPPGFVTANNRFRTCPADRGPTNATSPCVRAFDHRQCLLYAHLRISTPPN